MEKTDVMPPDCPPPSSTLSGLETAELQSVLSGANCTTPGVNGGTSLTTVELGAGPTLKDGADFASTALACSQDKFVAATEDDEVAAVTEGADDRDDISASAIEAVTAAG